MTVGPLAFLKGDDYLRYQLVFLLKSNLIGRPRGPTRDVGFPSKLGALGRTDGLTGNLRD